MMRILFAVGVVLILWPLAFSEERWMPGKPVTAPWLPQSDQDAIRAIWPKGVPLTANTKFYKLPQKAQSLYELDTGGLPWGGGIPRRDIIPAPNDGNPHQVSGGMHIVLRGEWRNVTGLDLPKPIKVWEEYGRFGSSIMIPKWRWEFPTGTLAYDVLLKKNADGSEHVFEVRVQEKLEGKWDEGSTYRPKVDIEGIEKTSRAWSFSNVGIEARAAVYKVNTIDPNAEFVLTRNLAVDDGKFTPHGYMGTGIMCNTCHNQIGKDTAYGVGKRGQDGRYSWHPWDSKGNIDKRWPLKIDGKPTPVNHKKR